jgi:Protein of unknown function (DUF3455)
MTNWNVPEKKTTRRILLAACSTALAMALTVSLPQTTHAKHVTPPPVPSDIQVPEGNKAFLEGHAVGTQNYICLPCPNATTPAAMCPDASGFAWILFTPQATLFNDRARQVTTHFFSPNPVETGTVRPTWQHSRDTSTVWGGRAVSSSAPDFVAPDAIPWLLIPVAGAEEGATGGDILTATTFIQRLSTSGGLAPSTGCSLSTEVGARAFVPYTAVYFFFREDDGN